jgi:[CysO sulfur-carrier protein]-S-L-cysteine hydrolase
VADGLIVSRELARGMLDHARGELPNEACALLGGDEASGRVTSLHLARNRLASPYRYDVEPDDLVRIVHDIELCGEALFAVFHSHPATSAVPSPSDLREARYPVVHLVASLADAGRPVIRAWRITANRAREVPLRIE